jgi:hypothetical protein
VNLPFLPINSFLLSSHWFLWLATKSLKGYEGFFLMGMGQKKTRSLYIVLKSIPEFQGTP